MKKHFFKLHLATFFIFLLFLTANQPATAGWSEMDSGTTKYLFGIWGSLATDVFAVGVAGTILHYDGSTWSEMTSGTTRTLYDIWGSLATDVFAVGSDGTILHYDGSIWSEMDSGTTRHLWGSSATDVFAVGGGGTILHYDGVSGICLSKLIYGEHSEETELLRYIRDNVLNQTPEGRELIELYYQWSPP